MSSSQAQPFAAWDALSKDRTALSPEMTQAQRVGPRFWVPNSCRWWYSLRKRVVTISGAFWDLFKYNMWDRAKERMQSILSFAAKGHLVSSSSHLCLLSLSRSPLLVCSPNISPNGELCLAVYEASVSLHNPCGGTAADNSAAQNPVAFRLMTFMGARPRTWTLCADL